MLYVPSRVVRRVPHTSLPFTRSCHQTIEVAVFAGDEPHLASSGFFRTEEHPTEGPLRVTRHPLDFSGVVEQPSRPAPHMGEHNRDILTEAGLTAEEITGLEASGVLGRVE